MAQKRFDLKTNLSFLMISINLFCCSEKWKKCNKTSLMKLHYQKKKNFIVT